MIDAITTSVLSTGVFAVAAFYLIKRFAPDGRQESNRYHAYYAASATLFGGFFLFFIIVALKALMPSYHRLFDILNFSRRLPPPPPPSVTAVVCWRKKNGRVMVLKSWRCCFFNCRRVWRF